MKTEKKETPIYRPFTIYVESETKKELKKVAANNEKTMTDLINEAIQEIFKKYKK